MCLGDFGNAILSKILCSDLEKLYIYIFNCYLGFIFTLNTVYVILRWVVLCAEETSTQLVKVLYCKLQPSTTNFPTYGMEFEPPTSEVGDECLTTVDPYIFMNYTFKWLFKNADIICLLTSINPTKFLITKKFLPITQETL